jgi:hypothetical protein
MADKKTYTVHRAMHGDGKDYARGDTREMTETDAAPLVASGALSPEGEEPAARAAGVEHTFGTKPSTVNDRGYTSATGEGIAAPRAAPANKPAAKKNA